MNATGNAQIQQVLADVLQERPTLPQSVEPSIAAVVTVEDDLRFLTTTLRSIVAQSVLPSTIVVADCTGGTSQPVHAQFTVSGYEAQRGSGSGSAEGMVVQHIAHSVDVQLVRAKGARSFGDAVDRGLRYAHIGDSVRALWLLHDDSCPRDVNCLETMLEAWHNAPAASLLGAKQLDWNGETLHEVGSYAGRHRIERLVVDGEPDQEQYDARRDVFAVSLAGALVPLATLQELNGCTTWFGTFGEAADFSRRICLHGGRVVVVPRARIAHRRARFEGIRSHDGEVVDADQPALPVMALLRAQQRYYYTDIHMIWWPVMWIIGLLASIGRAISRLIAKQPWGAWCELCLPWVSLSDLAGAIPARSKVARHSVVSLGKLPTLVADHRQVAQWRARSRALDHQQHTVLLSALAVEHLRTRAWRRWSGALGMAAVCTVAIITAYWPVLTAVMAGSSLYSPSLPASAATYRQLVDAATTPWVFGVDTGYPAPPTPFLLVWLVAASVSVGHANAAIALMFFAAPALSALSFWALAGIFTRSNVVRVVSGLLWSSLGVVLGLYHQANLAMLVVMVFLPAAYAFVFRAVGRYRTEEPAQPHPSIQACACASLAFIPVVAAEPQLLFPLTAIFLIFVLFIPRHRIMLLLIPIPSAFAIAPTLVNAIRYAHEGAFRQLFGDISIPSQARSGPPSAQGLSGVFARAFGFGAAHNDLNLMNGDIWQIAAAVTVLVLALLAIAALFMPSALRVSRLMWVVALAGMLIAMVSSRLAVAVDVDGTVAGSVLPGVSMAMLGLLSGACMIAGGAVQRFSALKTSSSATETSTMMQGSARHRTAIRVGRGLLVVVLILITGIWLFFGSTRNTGSTVEASQQRLPMVATDYLEKGQSRRILTVQAETGNIVHFTVMRTGSGDLLDSSPALRAHAVANPPSEAHQKLAAVSAGLLANVNPDAIATLGKLGIGGIYVAAPDGQVANEDATQQLISNITGSDGAQLVVDASAGTYYRLTDGAAHSDGIDTSGQQRTQHGSWRRAWLWCLASIVGIYCLVAVPRSRRLNLEQS